MRLAKASTDPILHDIVGNRHILLNTHDIHHLHHTDAEEPGVHPVFIAFGSVGNLCKL